MAHILVTGANGQLGSEIYANSELFPDLDIYYADRAQLDITNKEDIARFLDRHPFQYLINGAAYTAVDRAETEPELARKVNAAAPGLLAGACKERGMVLFHYSSDYVYHTEHNRPYREDDYTAPRGVYAQTKLEGDQAVLENEAQAVILRTSWVYSSSGHNFVKTILRLGKERNELQVVFDQIGSPTYAGDLAHATLHLIRKAEMGRIPKEKLSGLFHYSNEGVCSWYDFALAVLELAHIKCKVYPISTRDYPTPAERPPFSLLDKSKIKETFGIEIPHWRESLGVCLKVLS